MLRKILLGFIMGTTNLIPGVSAGTIAVISGKFDEIIFNLSNLISLKNIKSSFFYLFPIGIGILFSLITLPNLISFLINNYNNFLMSFFSGLIISGIIFLSRKTKIKEDNILILVISFILFFFIFLFVFKDQSIIEFEKVNFMYLILIGIIVSSTMVLPGISGSTILLIFGLYDYILNSLKDFNFVILLPFIIGVIIGIIFIIKLIKFLLIKNEDKVMLFLIGLTSAGLLKIIPSNITFFSILFIIFGIIAGYYFEMLFNKK